MVERRALSAPVENAKFVSSGSFLFDKVLGGGWGRGRVCNLVGDKSSGKTLLAIEACANVALAGGLSRSRYGEAESAFDEDYAASIGMPAGLERPPSALETVEDFQEDLQAYLAERMKDKGAPGIYVLDSLDALSDRDEMVRELDKGSYGAAKAKNMSKLFRMCTSEISEADVMLMVISQIRDKLNVTFGETKTRSGGRALDFYASQIVWLAEVGKIKRTVKTVERVIGAKVLAKNKKNKLGMPFREAELTVIFNYGVDDQISMLNWMTKNSVGTPEKRKALTGDLMGARSARDKAAMRQIDTTLRGLVGTRWDEIEEALKPVMSKYGDR